MEPAWRTRDAHAARAAADAFTIAAAVDPDGVLHQPRCAGATQLVSVAAPVALRDLLSTDGEVCGLCRFEPEDLHEALSTADETFPGRGEYVFVADHGAGLSGWAARALTTWATGTPAPDGPYVGVLDIPKSVLIALDRLPHSVTPRGHCIRLCNTTDAHRHTTNPDVAGTLSGFWAGYARRYRTLAGATGRAVSGDDPLGAGNLTRARRIHGSFARTAISACTALPAGLDRAHLELIGMLAAHASVDADGDLDTLGPETITEIATYVTGQTACDGVTAASVDAITAPETTWAELVDLVDAITS